MSELTRRRLIQSGLLAAASVSFGPAFWRDAFAAPPTVVGPGPYGPLMPPDANGLMLPSGFTSRVIARGGQTMPGRGYVFPAAPDGQATFAMPDGGWVLVTNSELRDVGTGGASAIRFNAAGTIVDSYRILGGTSVNCAGGPTPWGTWLSCEEVPSGQVWECDPTGNTAAVAHPPMGWFQHEACCVDPVHEHLYLSEDVDGGCLYRFVPNDYPHLNAGALQVACPGPVAGTVEWKLVNDPNPILPGGTPTRSQIPEALKFRRGEGMWFDSGRVYLVTTADHKIHVYDTGTGALSILFEAAQVPGTPLVDPDNIHVSSRSGDVFVAEDEGDADPLDVCVIAPDGQIARFLKMTGPGHGGSEVIGLTFDPSGTRFYAGSQRFDTTGVVYEITGPFRPYTPAPPVPPAPPPQQPEPPAPGMPIGVTIARRISIANLIRRGLAIALTLDEASTVRFRLTARITTNGRRRTITLATATRNRSAGTTRLRLRPTQAGARLLRARRRQITATLELRITTPGAPVRTLRRSVRLRP
jgi:hypothetical protein